MARRVSFSGEILSLDRVVAFHADADAALKLFFSSASPSYSSRFAGYTTIDVVGELEERRVELDRGTTMNVLAAVEAAFRIDYLTRSYRKGRDDISRAFWNLYQHKAAKASFEDDILEIWKSQTVGNAALIGELRGAFRFRHWMAHGRYWTPKLGRKYDYVSVYPLALGVLSRFPLLRA